MQAPSKTAMKFLGLAAKVNSWNHQLEGTHINNMKDWWVSLEGAGYVTVNHPWVKITPAGSKALMAHAAAGGRVAK